MEISGKAGTIGGERAETGSAECVEWPRESEAAAGATQREMTETRLRQAAAYRAKGDLVVVHEFRGCDSNRRLDEEKAGRVMEAIEQRYRDFGPTLAYVAKEVGTRIVGDAAQADDARRHLAGQAGQAAAGAHGAAAPQCRGELMRWDTSVHAWREDRGREKMYPVALIDDATSTLFARSVPADSTHDHMRVLRSYVERNGRPQAVYTDKASLFQPTLAPGWQDEELGPKNETRGRGRQPRCRDDHESNARQFPWNGRATNRRGASAQVDKNGPVTLSLGPCQ
jgi:hypothetical protein